MVDFSNEELPDDLRSLDAELSSLRYEERASFVPELRAELARAWVEEPARRRAVRRRRLSAAALVALLVGGAAVPSARASFVRLITVLTPEATEAVEEVPEEAVADATTASPAEAAPGDVGPYVEPEATPEAVELPTSELRDAPRLAPQMVDRARAEAMLQEAYPRSLQLGQIGGTVWLRMRVDDRGSVSEPSVARSSGVEELDAVAVSLAPRFQFLPAMQGGESVGTWIEFPVLFDPDPAHAARSLEPVVDPLNLPTIDRTDWWQLSQPLDPSELSESTWQGGTLADELAAAEQSLADAIADPSVLERYGPASAILEGLAPERVLPTEWRERVVGALEDAVEAGRAAPASLLALGRIRLRQGVRAEARRLFEGGLRMALADAAAVSPWLVAELHYERGSLVRDNWRASNGVGRVRAEGFAGASCDAARSSGGAGTGFASVERLVAWNYLCPGELDDIFESGFEADQSEAADLTLMMASFRAAIEAYAPHDRANTAFLLTLVSEGRWDDALRGARRFARVTGGHPDGLLLAGMALHRLDRSAEAEPLLREALERMDPNRADELHDIAVLLKPTERDYYRRLPVDERRAWETDFWSGRDRVPATAVNERWVEHVTRGAYAQLALGGVFGDAGEVWVRFGGPDTIHIVDAGSGRLTEFWDYGSGPDITFVRWVSSERMDLTPEGRAYVDDLGRAFAPE